MSYFTGVLIPKTPFRWMNPKVIVSSAYYICIYNKVGLWKNKPKVQQFCPHHLTEGNDYLTFWPLGYGDNFAFKMAAKDAFEPASTNTHKTKKITHNIKHIRTVIGLTLPTILLFILLTIEGVLTTLSTFDNIDFDRLFA